MRAASLLGVFILAKVCILAGRDLPLSPWTPIAYLWQDCIVVLLFAAVDWLTQPSKETRHPIGWSLYGLIVLYVALNVPVARALSTPLTWPLLRAAGAPLADSITYYATLANVSLTLLVVAAAVVLPLMTKSFRLRVPGFGLFRLTTANPETRNPKPETRNPKLSPAWVVVAVCVLLGPFAAGRVETVGLHRNAVAALVMTAFPSAPPGGSTGEWRASPFPALPADNLRHYRGAARGRNVVLVSLESTAAEYLRAYGAGEDPMPNLTNLARRAILFEDAYAVYPESIKGLFSIICSTYPAIHTAPEAYERVIPALPATLAAAGYRTGLFHSGRFGYLGMESVVRRRGYHTLEDAGDVGGDHNSSFGVDEPSTVRRILSWVDAQPRGEPLFITYLPIAGHHPYETPEAGPFPETDELGRYRNALHYADQALGLLMRGLGERGLDQNTLWVIFGDHGEAFGQHEGNFGHTLFVYDENVRVPFLLAAPGLVTQQVRVGRIASLIDTAPTVLDLLGLPAPQDWQGQSLLEDQPRLALFFTDYSLSLAGLRDGRWKLIHELDSGRSKLFDAYEDRAERHDLAPRFPDRVAAYREHVLRWCGAQRELILSRARE